VWVKLNVVSLTSPYTKHHTTHALATAHTMLLTLRNADQHKKFAAAGFLDSHAHINDPESITDPMLQSRVLRLASLPDRLCVHAGDGRTNPARVDSMLRLSHQDTGLQVRLQVRLDQ